MPNLIDNFLLWLHNYKPKKREKPPIDYTSQRKTAGDIIIGVLTEHFCVREGLLMFPKDALDDPSIQAAWFALCHYEADEDLRRRDINYADEQQKLLEMIAFTFKDGKELPQNIISAYEKYHSEVLIAPQRGWRAILRKLTRFINI